MDIKNVIDESIKFIESRESLLKLLESMDLLFKTDGDGLKYRIPGFYEIYSYDEVYVFGDLHGDLSSLTKVFNELNLIDKLENENVKLVFLGDYIDRGERQLETILSLLVLKTHYPTKVILLRGNHEPAPIVEPSPHDFPLILKLIYGGEDGELIYRRFLKLFNRMPFGARVKDKILMLHGGPPVEVLNARSFEEAFSIGLPMLNDSVLEQVLWNDPYEAEKYEASYRGAGYLFGPSVTERTLELASVKYIVRGHEPVHGFKLDHGGRVITVFCASNVYGTYRVGFVHIEKESQLVNPRDFVKMI